MIKSYNSQHTKRRHTNIYHLGDQQLETKMELSQPSGDSCSVFIRYAVTRAALQSTWGKGVNPYGFLVINSRKYRK